MSIINGTVVGAETGFYPTTIDQSLRLNDNDSAYLSWTPTSTGNRKTWTFSTWVKLGNLTTPNNLPIIFDAGTSGNDQMQVRFNGNKLNFMFNYTLASGVQGYLATSQVFRDVSSWYHLVFVADTSNATASERLKIYVNGERITAFDTANYPSQNLDGQFNSGVLQRIGHQGWSAYDYFDGYLAETHFIDGTAYDATAFGEFKNGVWIPKTPSVTYGTNGFYLDYSNGASIGADSSGNGNNWTPTNLASTDVMLDSPTNNFATLNSTQPLSGLSSLAEGNLQSVGLNATYGGHVPATFSATTGKWYFEVNIKTLPSAGGSWPIIGIVENLLTTAPNDDYAGDAGLRGVGYIRSGDINVNGSTVTTVTGTTTGDIVGVAFDVDAGTCALYLNGTLKYTATGLTGSSYTPDVSNYYNSVCIANFGQDSSFAGNKVPQGYTDANGRGDFYYAPPAGYLALCTQNLPEPAIGPNSATTADENFNTVLWTGNGTSQSIDVGFQSDLTWYKDRSDGTENHWVFDAIRTADYGLIPNLTDGEYNITNSITDFTSTGFDIGSNGNINRLNDAYVAWNWKADNTSGSTNTDGTITSTVSANVDAGFSIVSYTGTGANATVGHGLSSAPEFIIVKDRDNAYNWNCYHKGIASDAETDWIKLNLSDAADDDISLWNDTAPTSSVFSLGSNIGVNQSGDNYIAYCFHSVPQFSKCFSYTGNGSADGPFVTLDFEPAFVMIKRTDTTANWGMFDNQRLGYNVRNDILYPNLSNAEGAAEWIDFTSNGFKLRYTHAQINASGGTYIYMAFAKTPAKYSLAR